jgi:hypothetical protein
MTKNIPFIFSSEGREEANGGNQRHYVANGTRRRSSTG